MERCRARNRLTCRKHGIPLDFVGVPAYIAENLDRLTALNEAQLHANSELDAAALMEGILPSEVGRVAYHDPAGQVPLRTLMHEALEAEYAFVGERSKQYRDAIEYIELALLRELPEYPRHTRLLLANLVCLRFLILEREHGVSAEHFYERTFGLSRTELLMPLVQPHVRDVLRQCDRAFITFITGLLPDEEDLVSLAYERIIRRQRPVVQRDIDRALPLIERIFHRTAGDEDDTAED